MLVTKKAFAEYTDLNAERIGGVINEVQGAKQDIESLKKELNGIKESVASINRSIALLNESVKNLADQVSDLFDESEEEKARRFKDYRIKSRMDCLQMATSIGAGKSHSDIIALADQMFAFALEIAKPEEPLKKK